MTALLSQLTAAKNGLEDAQITLCGAVTAHAEAEDALAEARCTYELARLEWDLARYSVRVLEPYREAA